MQTNQRDKQVNISFHASGYGSMTRLLVVKAYAKDMGHGTRFSMPMEKSQFKTTVATPRRMHTKPTKNMVNYSTGL